MAGVVDKMSYALSVRDYNEMTREVTIKHYRIRKLDRGGVYISPKKSFSDLLQLVDHYHSEYIASRSNVKGAYSFLWIGNPSQSYGASPAIWDHTVLPATRHR